MKISYLFHSSMFGNIFLVCDRLYIDHSCGFCFNMFCMDLCVCCMLTESIPWSLWLNIRSMFTAYRFLCSILIFCHTGLLDFATRQYDFHVPCLLVL